MRKVKPHRIADAGTAVQRRPRFSRTEASQALAMIRRGVDPSVPGSMEPAPDPGPQTSKEGAR
jgi:hypothetical protein